jgi:hypothetical protein
MSGLRPQLGNPGNVSPTFGSGVATEPIEAIEPIDPFEPTRAKDSVPMWLAEAPRLDPLADPRPRLAEEEKRIAKAHSASKPFSKESNRADSTRANSTESSLSNHAARLAGGSLSDKLKLLKSGQKLVLPSSASKNDVGPSVVGMMGEGGEGAKRVNTSYGKHTDALVEEDDKPRNVVPMLLKL